MDHPDGPSQNPSGSSKIDYQQDAAGYIAALIAELRNLSGMAELDKLTRALDAAYYEAYAVTEQKRRPRGTVAGTSND